MTDTPAAPPADLTADQIYAMTPEQAGAGPGLDHLGASRSRWPRLDGDC
jgi:hypothetical protein